MSSNGKIKLSEIHGMENPIRGDGDSEKMDELIASIKTMGVIVPIKVRPNTVGYEIVYGHRRYYAAKAAGLTEIPAIVVDIDGLRAREEALAENIAGIERMSDLERGLTFAKIKEDRSPINNEGIGAMYGLSGSMIARYIKLANDKIVNYVDLKSASISHSFADKASVTRPLGDSEKATEQRARLLSVPEVGTDHTKLRGATKAIMPLSDGDRDAVLDKTESEQLTPEHIEQVSAIVKEAEETGNERLRESALMLSPRMADYNEARLHQRSGLMAHVERQQERKANKKAKEIEEYDQLVKDGIGLLRALNAWVVDIAPDGIEQGKFSPEGARFIMRRMAVLQGAYESIENDLERIAEGK